MTEAKFKSFLFSQTLNADAKQDSNWKQNENHISNNKTYDNDEKNPFEINKKLILSTSIHDKTCSDIVIVKKSMIPFVNEKVFGLIYKSLDINTEKSKSNKKRAVVEIKAATEKEEKLMGKCQMSIQKNNLLDYLEIAKNNKVIVKHIRDPSKYLIDLIELYIKDIYLSRGDMWTISNFIVNNFSCCYFDQIFKVFNSIDLTVSKIHIGKSSVFSGIIDRNKTKIVFRSKSSKLTFLIQLSSDIYHFDVAGSLTYNRIINSLLPAIFKTWIKMGTHHLVTIILFTSVINSEDAELLEKASPGEIMKNTKDYYRIVVDQINISQWSKIIINLRHEILRSKEDIDVIRHKLLPSSKGNLLQALNLSTILMLNNVNNLTSLRHTQNHFILISPGSGIIDIDYEILNKITYKILMLDISVDLICMGAPPAHQTPIFRYKNLKGDVVCRFPVWFNCYFWINNKFVNSLNLSTEYEKLLNSNNSSEKQLDLKDDQAGYNHIFELRCKIYELQMMGVMEYEMSGMKIPFLSNNSKKANTVISIGDYMHSYDHSVFRRSEPNKYQSRSYSSIEYKMPNSSDFTSKQQGILYKSQKVEIIDDKQQGRVSGLDSTTRVVDQPKILGITNQVMNSAYSALKQTQEQLVLQKITSSNQTLKLLMQNDDSNSMLSGITQDSSRRFRSRADSIDNTSFRSGTNRIDNRQLLIDELGAALSKATTNNTEHFDNTTYVSQNNNSESESGIVKFSKKVFSLINKNASKNDNGSLNKSEDYTAYNTGTVTPIQHDQSSYITTSQIPSRHVTPLKTLPREIHSSLPLVKHESSLPRILSSVEENHMPISGGQSYDESFQRALKRVETGADLVRMGNKLKKERQKARNYEEKIDSQKPDRKELSLFPDNLPNVREDKNKYLGLLINNLGKPSETKLDFTEIDFGKWNNIYSVSHKKEDPTRRKINLRSVYHPDGSLLSSTTVGRQVSNKIPKGSNNPKDDNLINWKSLITPASVPTTTTDFPAIKDLKFSYSINNYEILPTRLFSDIMTGKDILKEMVSSRLMMGFQICDLSKNRSINKFEMDEQNSSNFEFIFNYLPDDFDNYLSTDESMKTPVSFGHYVIYLSLGDEIHRLFLDAFDNVKITIYKKKTSFAERLALSSEEDQNTYDAYVRTRYDPSYREVKFDSNIFQRSNINWSRIDYYLAGNFDESHAEFEFDDRDKINVFQMKLIIVDNSRDTKNKGENVCFQNDRSDFLENIKKFLKFVKRSEYSTRNYDSNFSTNKHQKMVPLLIDIDPMNKTHKLEFLKITYDNIENNLPTNRLYFHSDCFHVKLQWLTTTPKLIDDLITKWIYTCEANSLKLIEVPTYEVYRTPKINPFHSTVQVSLGLNPWNFPEKYFPQNLENSIFKYYYHHYLLLDSDFCLEEANDEFLKTNFRNDSLDNKSITESDVLKKQENNFKYAQYVHLSGAYIAEIKADGTFFLVPNNIYIARMNLKKLNGDLTNEDFDLRHLQDTIRINKNRVPRVAKPTNRVYQSSYSDDDYISDSSENNLDDLTDDSSDEDDHIEESLTDGTATVDRLEAGDNLGFENHRISDYINIEEHEDLQNSLYSNDVHSFVKTSRIRSREANRSLSSSRRSLNNSLKDVDYMSNSNYSFMKPSSIKKTLDNSSTFSGNDKIDQFSEILPSSEQFFDSQSIMIKFFEKCNNPEKLRIIFDKAKNNWLYAVNNI